ncbi:MAG: SRPBCC domain-containing protein [Flavobacteriales bacterium]|nr:SRPBCC domain-containing protein [Flavobacteriales bacterium]MBP9080026.1 SRPBCC domain-containing protein [Flavobacteriales bacterium]
MEPITTTDTRTLVLTRTLNAPIELVFEAWCDPKHLVRWWGPKEFTLPHCEQDFRVGGNYRFCMRAPDGTDHWVRGEYTHINAPSRLVFTWLRDAADGDLWCDTIVEIAMERRGLQTLLTLSQTTFATVAHCEEHAIGWGECLDRLARIVLHLHQQHQAT